MYYSNTPGVTNRTTSAQGSQYTFGPAYSAGANNPALGNAYMLTAGQYNSGNGQSNGNGFVDPAVNLPGTAREYDHLMTTLYGSGNGGVPLPGGTPGWNSQTGTVDGQGGNQGSGQGGWDTVTSTINPQGIYSPEAMAKNTSHKVANAFAAGDGRLLQQKFAGRGRSLDSGTRSAVMPAVAGAENAAAEAMVASPIQDWYANQQNILQGQVGRAGESLGLANIMDQLRGAQQQNQMSMIMPMLQAAMAGGGF